MKILLFIGIGGFFGAIARYGFNVGSPGTFEVEKCRDVVLKNLMPLSEASRDLLLMARDELKFNIDRKKYHALMNRVADEGQQRLTDFMNTVREEANKRMQ